MKKNVKKNKENIALTIIVSIILVIMVVALVNVGMSLVKENPQYDDFCDIRKPTTVVTQSECTAQGGEWTEYNQPVERDLEGTLTEGYCDMYKECSDAYDNAQRNYNQLRFYILAIIGFILLLYGLHTTSAIIQYTGLGSGGILFLEGVVLNFQNKIVVFITLLIIIGAFGYFAKRIIEK